MIFGLINVRSGNINRNNGALPRLGSYGRAWSSSAANYAGPFNDSTRAYRLGFNEAEIVSAQGPVVRWYGFPVRCLVILC